MLHSKSVIASAVATALVTLIGLAYAQSSDTTTPSTGAPSMDSAAPSSTDANKSPSPTEPAASTDMKSDNSGSTDAGSQAENAPKADRN